MQCRHIWHCVSHACVSGPQICITQYMDSPQWKMPKFFSSFLLPPGFQNVIITIVNRTHVVRISAQWGISRSTAPLSHASLHPTPLALPAPLYASSSRSYHLLCVFQTKHSIWPFYIWVFFVLTFLHNSILSLKKRRLAKGLVFQFWSFCWCFCFSNDSLHVSWILWSRSGFAA